MRRSSFYQAILRGFKVNPVLAILGPRQCGKTTLARKYLEDQKAFRQQNYFDLERPSDIQRLSNPELVLSQLNGLITIDEIQRIRELFPVLRVMVDDPDLAQHYLILGSASRELIRQSSETLAGRITYLELTPFNLSEVDDRDRLWLQGGFPRSYLEKDPKLSYEWRQHYIRTYLEVDVPNLGINIQSENLRRFWMMLTHYHGQILNASELGRSLNLTYNTILNYTDVLRNTFMIRVLQPWHENIKKRQVKSPKIYFRDSGLLHALLRIDTMDNLQLHPKLGASWEGFALEEVIRALKVDHEDCYFWATHANAELDLLVFKEGKRLGFEFKYADAPKKTKSMTIAMEDLNLDSLTVICPGKVSYPLTEKITVCGLNEFVENASA